MEEKIRTKRSRLFHRFADAAYFKNPVLLLLGIAPMLMCSQTLKDGLAMSVSVSVMLIISNACVSVQQKIIPQKFRLVACVAINAAVVTVLYCIAEAFIPFLAYSLYPVLPFLIANSLFLYRAEAYASQRSLGYAVSDGIFVGFGFIFVSVIVSAIRELLGLGTLFGFRIFTPDMSFDFALIPAGGLIIIGCIIAFINYINDKTGKGGRSL